ncbi:hypothetical protein DPMN_061316 [Dreissena polymorpha]|uniref:Uncharacterized protein n=1 Tax=Dreissena polymorpha TaxID=45954 RepID=A0A9D4C6S5_DREPO|nr:hypothetical protein DPMN_061316 [Dreissena polymorpha]
MSLCFAVYKCAVSPTGDKLYIINSLQHKLLTLARNGTRLATYTDPDREGPSCVHVTPAGQVLVCGYLSHTILHVDSEGRRKLATLSTGRYEVWCPESICYCSPSSCIIVGQRASNYILVYKVE